MAGRETSKPTSVPGPCRYCGASDWEQMEPVDPEVKEKWWCRNCCSGYWVLEVTFEPKAIA